MYFRNNIKIFRLAKLHFQSRSIDDNINNNDTKKCTYFDLISFYVFTIDIFRVVILPDCFTISNMSLLNRIIFQVSQVVK